MAVDYSPVCHATAAIALQCAVGIVFGMWGVGGALGCMWFIAREQTQAEYRWIAEFGGGKRENMPWWGGIDYKVWDFASALDLSIPVLTCSILWLIAP